MRMDPREQLPSPLESNPDILLARARAGDTDSLGRLLEFYRAYLRLVARSMVYPALRTRVDPSDLVQETFQKAHGDFDRFAGSGERAMVAWLRAILIRSLADQVKRHRAQERDHRRQESLESLLDRAGQAAFEAIGAPISTPSSIVSRREQAVLLAQAVERLPAHYREVFLLRNVEHVPFDEVAERMGRTPVAVRKLWTRAMMALKAMLEEES
jgi:RNA polymerase sigma-70 factor (ECF subfamily)